MCKIKKQNLNIHISGLKNIYMQDLAIILYLQGFSVTCSSLFLYNNILLKKYNLLPKKTGYFSNKISLFLDILIVEDSTKKENIELKKAKEINLKIYSYFEYIYQYSINKQKTIIINNKKFNTLYVIINILNYFKKEFNYFVKKDISNIKKKLKLNNSSIFFFEQNINTLLKFNKKINFKYFYNTLLISNINFFYKNINKFRFFINYFLKKSIIIYNNKNKTINNILINKIKKKSYNNHLYNIIYNKLFLKVNNFNLSIKIVKKNIKNIIGIKIILKNIGITSGQFYEAAAYIKLYY